MDINTLQPEPAFDAGQLRWRRVIRGGLAGGSARIVAVIISLVATPVAINEAGSTTYGLFAALTSFATLMAVADFGVGNGVIRELAVTRADTRPADEGPVISAAAGLLVMLGLLVIAVGAIAAWVVPWRSLLRAPEARRPEIRDAVLVAAVSVRASRCRGRSPKRFTSLDNRRRAQDYSPQSPPRSVRSR